MAEGSGHDRNHLPSDEICLSIGCLTEVTKEMEQKGLLEKFGYFDELTKLPKRSIMQRIIEMNIGNLHRGYIKDFVFLLLDIDHFKAVNDTHGHQAGDQILVKFGGSNVLHQTAGG